jgi:tripartite-type tricarboxylate transporter receptor subunit TctC
MRQLGSLGRVLGVALLALLAVPAAAPAQQWPTKPIHVLNPWPPGGPADFIAQPVFEKLAEVTTLKRASAFPSLPAVAETLPGFEMNTWYGLEAPAGTPAPIVERVQKGIAAILKNPEIAERLRGAALEPEGTTPAERAAQLRDDVARWGKLVRDAGITPE